MRILLLGGYGVFGGRLADLLSDLSDIELIIAGRSQARAEAFCTAYTGQPHLTPLALDRNDIAARLPELAPDILVDASGPFQSYGADPYSVVEACIAARIPYLDFADAADFVFGISRHDTAAKAAGIFVLSGVSSFPVLTAAVLREIAKGMEITSVTGGIAPSPHAGIGLNVMRAVVGYAGAPVKLWRDGEPGLGIGLAESRRYTIAPPGRLPLHNIRFSLVDVPDLQVIPPEHPGLQDIWMGAGTVPESLHRALNLLARARATLHLPSLAPLAPLFYRVLNLMRFGPHRGGMFVDAKGARGGRPAETSWHLLAEGDDGPMIPSMAVEAVLRKHLTGDCPAPGARSAIHALDLADYEALFCTRSIQTGFRHAPPPDAALYRRILGEAFDALPDRLRTLHDLHAPQTWSGSATVRRGRNLIARLIASMIGFPPAGDDIPVTVRLNPEGGKERWTRQFGKTRFHSIQSEGKGRNAHLLFERFGWITVALALVLRNDRLHLVPRRWTILGLRLPRSLLPRGDSFEHQTGGHFHFDVTIAAPLIGLIVAYRGALLPVP